MTSGGFVLASSATGAPSLWRNTAIEATAGANASLAQAIDSAMAAAEFAAPAQPLVGPEGNTAAGPYPFRLDKRALFCAFRGEGGRQMLPDFDPWQGQRAGVGQRRFQ